MSKEKEREGESKREKKRNRRQSKEYRSIQGGLKQEKKGKKRKIHEELLYIKSYRRYFQPILEPKLGYACLLCFIFTITIAT